MTMNHKQLDVLGRVQRKLRTSSSRSERVLASRLVHATLNVTPGSEDAPELVIGFESLMVEDITVLSILFDMNDCQVFGGSIINGMARKSCVELSGYVNGAEWGLI